MAARGVGPWRRRTTARSGRARGSVRREVGGAQERWARGRGPAMAGDGARGEELERGRRRVVVQRSSGGASSCGGGRRRSGPTTAASRRRWEQGTAAAKGADQKLTKCWGEGGGRREIYGGVFCPGWSHDPGQKALLSRVVASPGTKGGPPIYSLNLRLPPTLGHFPDLRRAAVISPIVPPAPPPSLSAARAPPPPRPGRLGRRPRQSAHWCAAVPGPVPPRLRRPGLHSARAPSSSPPMAASIARRRAAILSAARQRAASSPPRRPGPPPLGFPALCE